MMSPGVLAGTKNADHEETSTPATPASAMVGRPGATESRLALATARARSWPWRTSGRLDAVKLNMASMRPGMRSLKAAIGHVGHFDAGFALEQFAGEMERRAVARRCIAQRLHLGVRDELLDRVRRRGIRHD